MISCMFSSEHLLICWKVFLVSQNIMIWLPKLDVWFLVSLHLNICWFVEKLFCLTKYHDMFANAFSTIARYMISSISTCKHLLKSVLHIFYNSSMIIFFLLNTFSTIIMSSGFFLDISTSQHFCWRQHKCSKIFCFQNLLKEFTPVDRRLLLQ